MSISYCLQEMGVVQYQPRKIKYLVICAVTGNFIPDKEQQILTKIFAALNWPFASIKQVVVKDSQDFSYISDLLQSINPELIVGFGEGLDGLFKTQLVNKKSLLLPDISKFAQDKALKRQVWDKLKVYM